MNPVRCVMWPVNRVLDALWNEFARRVVGQ
jgi:hypothetical protein